MPINNNNQPISGLGDNNALLKVYMANQPSYTFLNTDKPTDIGIAALTKGEIYLAGQACGNGWRKVFNVYAKFVFALSSPLIGDCTCYAKWQDYRDHLLLQAQSKTALLFTPPVFSNTLAPANSIHIVMGKTYAKTLLNNHLLGNPDNMICLNDEFAINLKHRIIVCPYFDYRQLSNIKIMYLVNLIQSQLPLKLP